MDFIQVKIVDANDLEPVRVKEEETHERVQITVKEEQDLNEVEDQPYREPQSCTAGGNLDLEADACSEAKKFFDCPHCGKKYKSKEDLKDHMTVHGERPYVCLQCGKTYTQKINLQNHLLIHNGDKPFSCSQCKKSFTRKGDLKKHIIGHYGERPFTCHQCGNNFRHQGNLTSHMKIHTGEKSIAQCEKKMAQVCNYKSPVLYHAGEMPFKCVQCGQRFIMSAHLTRHMKWHAKARASKK